MYCTAPFLVQSWERRLMGVAELLSSHCLIISCWMAAENLNSLRVLNFEGQQNSHLVAQHKRNKKFRGVVLILNATNQKLWKYAVKENSKSLFLLHIIIYMLKRWYSWT
jgi:cell division protein FtsB